MTAGHSGHNVIIHPSAKVDASAQLGPNVVVGSNCIIQAGVKILNSTILSGTVVKSHTLIEGSIIGWKNTVGSWVRLTGLTCTAEDVQIQDLSYLNTVSVLPHKGVTGVHEKVVLM